MDALPYYKWHWQRWRANRRVQRLTLAEKGAYRELLDECWAEGFIPDDMPSLADICGCSEAEMAEVWTVIRDRFYEVGTGCLTNKTLEEQRTATDNLRAANARNGKAGAEAKIANAKEVEATAKRPPSDRQENSSERHIGEERRGEKRRGKKSSSRSKVASDDRHVPFREAFRKYFLHKNPGLDEEPWDGQEANQLNRFLKKNPRFTLDQWKILLNWRARSLVPHGMNLSTWIGSALKWATGPTDRFGNSVPPTGENNARDQSISDRNEDLIAQFRAEDMDFGENHNGRTLEAGRSGIEPQGNGVAREFVLRPAI